MPSTRNISEPTRNLSRRTSDSVADPSGAAVMGRAPSTQAARAPKTAHDGERHVESVTLGDIRFAAWYPSWYPQESAATSSDKVKELYVCPRCFAYSAGNETHAVQAWLRHWRGCGRTVVPGERIYVHGQWGAEVRAAPRTRSSPIRGAWSIWEVDGAKETLFCQNLSLFAKLFLDNKSVFFDVSGFNYFLLVHTSPITVDAPTPVPQIIGFFSKEKMSWDHNNLACILIFPPWQGKGLGSLLIGISYAIARREGILGGPERPISELGMKSYRGYWGREVSRFLLRRGAGAESRLDVEAISQATWISPEDCLAVLTEMDVVEGVDVSDAARALDEPTPLRDVRLDKQRVRDWVARAGIRLERGICEEGFRPGYACKKDLPSRRGP